MAKYAILISCAICLGLGRNLQHDAKGSQPSLRSSDDFVQKAQLASLSRFLLSLQPGIPLRSSHLSVRQPDNYLGHSRWSFDHSRVAHRSPLMLREDEAEGVSGKARDAVKGFLDGVMNDFGKAPKAGKKDDAGKKVDQRGPMRSSSRSFIRVFSDFRLAIGELAVIGVLCALATVLEQGQDPGFYESRYGSYSMFLGFLPAGNIKSSIAAGIDAVLPSPGGLSVLLGFDHMFSSQIFLGLGAAVAVSLMTCTYSRQLPMAKASQKQTQKWNFLNTAERFAKLDSAFKVDLPPATKEDSAFKVPTHMEANNTAEILSSRGYTVVSDTGADGGALGYAFKGLLGRFAPIGVHASMLMIILGSTYSALGTWRGQVLLDSGENIVVSEVVTPSSRIAPKFEGLNKNLRVDDFRIDFRPDGKVKQFYSDIALDTIGDKPSQATTIKVNTPLRKNGLTVYQTDWKVGAVRVRVRPLTAQVPDDSPEWREYELKMSPLGSDKFVDDARGGFLPLTRPADDIATPERKSIYGALFVATDLNQVVIYGPDGKFVGVRLADSGKPITVAGNEFVVTGLRGSTGLELKADPGVPFVYAGFAGTMLTTAVSLIPYNQVWFRQANKEFYLGGKSNRAKDQLNQELKDVLADAVRSAPALG